MGVDDVLSARLGLASTDELLDELLARLGRQFDHEFAASGVVKRAVMITELRCTLPACEREYRPGII